MEALKNENCGKIVTYLFSISYRKNKILLKKAQILLDSTLAAFVALKHI